MQYTSFVGPISHFEMYHIQPMVALSPMTATRAPPETPYCLMALEVPVMSMELHRHNFLQRILLAHQPLRSNSNLHSVCQTCQ